MGGETGCDSPPSSRPPLTCSLAEDTAHADVWVNMCVHTCSATWACSEPAAPVCPASCGRPHRAQAAPALAGRWCGRNSSPREAPRRPAGPGAAAGGPAGVGLSPRVRGREQAPCPPLAGRHLSGRWGMLKPACDAAVVLQWALVRFPTPRQPVTGLHARPGPARAPRTICRASFRSAAAPGPRRTSLLGEAEGWDLNPGPGAGGREEAGAGPCRPWGTHTLPGFEPRPGSPARETVGAGAQRWPGCLQNSSLVARSQVLGLGGGGHGAGLAVAAQGACSWEEAEALSGPGTLLGAPSLLGAGAQALSPLGSCVSAFRSGGAGPRSSRVTSGRKPGRSALSRAWSCWGLCLQPAVVGEGMAQAAQGRPHPARGCWETRPPARGGTLEPGQLRMGAGPGRGSPAFCKGAGGASRCVPDGGPRRHSRSRGSCGAGESRGAPASALSQGLPRPLSRWQPCLVTPRHAAGRGRWPGSAGLAALAAGSVQSASRSPSPGRGVGGGEAGAASAALDGPGQPGQGRLSIRVLVGGAWLRLQHRGRGGTWVSPELCSGRPCHGGASLQGWEARAPPLAGTFSRTLWLHQAANGAARTRTQIRFWSREWRAAGDGRGSAGLVASRDFPRAAAPGWLGGELRPPAVPPSPVVRAPADRCPSRVFPAVSHSRPRLLGGPRLPGVGGSPQTCLPPLPSELCRRGVGAGPSSCPPWGWPGSLELGACLAGCSLHGPMTPLPSPPEPFGRSVCGTCCILGLGVPESQAGPLHSGIHRAWWAWAGGGAVPVLQ